MQHNGVIGRSGTFYPCESTRHIETMLANTFDAPFAECKRGELITFDAWYADEGPTPTSEQFETAMQWCTECGVTFESATDCWSDPWLQWREDRSSIPAITRIEP